MLNLHLKISGMQFQYLIDISDNFRILLLPFNLNIEVMYNFRRLECEGWKTSAD